MSDFLEPNLAVATFLRTKGYTLQKFVQIGRTKLAFMFADHDGQIREVAESYARGASAPAELLLNNFSDLKKLMYEKKSEANGENREHDDPARIKSPLTTHRR